jgi:glycosyltransferase involved in cell wall biosynthesis
MLLSFSPSFVWEVVRNSDVVCLLGLLGVTGFATTMLAKLLSKPVVAINQAVPASVERRRSFWIRTAKRLVFALADVLVAQTPPTFETLVQIYGKPEKEIIYAPWDGGASEFAPVLDKYRPTSTAELRNGFNLDLDDYVILYSGTLVGLKGLDVLLQAFACVRQRLSSAQLLLAGADGRSAGVLSDLKKQAASLGISEQVHFLGRQSWDELAKLYLLADVFVLPTRKDMWPKVLVEAAMTGLPLVTTDRCGAAGYIVRDGQNGCVIPANDTDALCRSLLELADKSLRQAMSSSSHQIVEEYVQLSRHQSQRIVEAIQKASKHIDG